MPYRVIKDDQFIGTHPYLAVGPAGELVARANPYERATSVYAPGTWDHVFWEDPEDGA